MLVSLSQLFLFVLINMLSTLSQLFLKSRVNYGELKAMKLHTSASLCDLVRLYVIVFFDQKKIFFYYCFFLFLFCCCHCVGIPQECSIQASNGCTWGRGEFLTHFFTLVPPHMLLLLLILERTLWLDSFYI